MVYRLLLIDYNHRNDIVGFVMKALHCYSFSLKIY